MLVITRTDEKKERDEREKRKGKTELKRSKV